MTVDRNNVEVYAQLANLLFKNLYGQELIIQQDNSKELLVEFLSEWVILEKGLYDLTQTHSLVGTRRNTLNSAFDFLSVAGIIDEDEIKEISKLREVRNSVIHGTKDFKKILTKDIIEKVKYYAHRFKDEE